MTARIALATTLALVGFASNSLLCRLAIREDAIDPASFTAIRLVSGAAALALLARGRLRGSHAGAVALWAYALLFSFAYQALGAATGALLLFGAVQLTMLLAGLRSGERLALLEVAGWAGAAAGVVVLIAPGLSAPDPLGAALMLLAGVAWGVYSVLGRGVADPLRETAGNFARSSPLALLSFLPFWEGAHADARGIGWALVSGVITSGLGYSLWYLALPVLGALRAAMLQLTVPILAALAAVVLLGEVPSARLWGAAGLVVGGVAAAVVARGRSTSSSPPGRDG